MAEDSAKKEAKKKSIGLEILRFVVVGLVAAICDFLTKSITAWGLGKAWDSSVEPYSALTLGISVFAGFVIGVIVNYILSRIWVFQNVADKKKANSQSRFWLFVFLGFIGLLISEGIFYGLHYALLPAGVSVVKGSESIMNDWKKGNWAFLGEADFWTYAGVFVFSTLVVMVWNYLSRKKWIFVAPKEKKEDASAPMKQDTQEAKAETAEKKEEEHEEEAAEPAEAKEPATDLSARESPREGPQEVIVEEPKPAVSKQPASKAKPKAAANDGKYEIYPEAGRFHFRLKANNGEILFVSSPYTSKEGAAKGIVTFQKNVATGKTSFYTDKNNYSSWRLFTPNDGRLIAAGEVYSTMDSAQSAWASVTRFAPSAKTQYLDALPESEAREWAIDVSDVKPKANGKVEFFLDPETNKYRARLLANNGQVLFVTDGSYVNRSGAMNGVYALKKLVAANAFVLAKDKQGRYQFQLYSKAGGLLIKGESYASKDRAISAAKSVASFLPEAAYVDANAAKVEDKPTK